MESILTSIKKLLGITEEYEHFDADLIIYINSTFLVLKQLGVGPTKGFVIVDEGATWADFIPDDAVLREATKAYMGAKVRLKFDPPTNSALLNALTQTIAEYEWRLNVEVENNAMAEAAAIGTDGIVLTDNTTGINYRLYVDSSKLKIDKEGD